MTDDQILKSPFLVASLSPYASNEKSNGHYYWMYQHIQESQNGTSGPLTVSQIGRTGPHLAPLLSPRRPSRRVYIGDWWSRNSDQRAITGWLRNEANNKVTHVQCYDGTVRDLLILDAVARDFPTVTFLFNFHWAIDWLDISSSSRLHRRLLRRQLRKLLQTAPTNLNFSAESSILASELGSRWGITISTYPVFTMQNTNKYPPWGGRKSDVLVIPQRNHELSISADIAEVLRSEGITVSVGLSKRLAATSNSRADLLDFDRSFDRVFHLPLSSEQYHEMLASHRIVILPYLKHYFRWGSSGKFNEAIALGTFPMVPDETAIASQSTLDPRIHHFPAGSPDESKRVIMARLAGGFPEGLKPVNFADFADWLRAFPENNPTVHGVREQPFMATVYAIEIVEETIHLLTTFLKKQADLLWKKRIRDSGTE